MSRTNYNLARGIAVVLAVGLAHGRVAVAQVDILSDDFGVRTNGQNDGCPAGTETCFTDWGDNNNALGGTVTQTYITTPDRTSPGGVNSTVLDVDDPLNGESEGVVRFGAIQIDHNLAADPNVLAGGGYSLEVDVRRGSGGFAGIHFGADQNFVATTLNGAAFVVLETDTDVSFLLQDDGGGGKRVKFIPFGDDDENMGAAKVMDIGGLSDEEFDVKIDVSAPNGFDNGDTVTYDVTVDGMSVYSEDILVDGLFSGYVGFASNSGGVAGGIYDNIKITAFEATLSGVVGDYNNDGTVNAADVTIWADHLGTPFELLIRDPANSGDVSPADYNSWLNNFGNSASGNSAAIPEPTTLVAVLVAMLVSMQARSLRVRVR